jgi:hypothetical protein
LRRAADYIREYKTVASSDVREVTGLTDKQVNAEVASGRLLRKRSVGWEYQTAPVRDLILLLAADLESAQATA